jgi:hypothetical protein
MKKNSPAFEIKVKGFNLRLVFSSPDEEDWCYAFTEVSADPFSGHYAFQVLSSELNGLLKKLQELEHSFENEFAITWENYEGNIQLKLSFSAGQLVGSYRLAAGLGWEGANLSGDFQADQSYLGDLVQQLKQVQSKLG